MNGKKMRVCSQNGLMARRGLFEMLLASTNYGIESYDKIESVKRGDMKERSSHMQMDRRVTPIVTVRNEKATNQCEDH